MHACTCIWNVNFYFQNLKDTAEQFTQLEHDYQQTLQRLQEKQTHFDQLQQVEIFLGGKFHDFTVTVYFRYNCIHQKYILNCYYESWKNILDKYSNTELSHANSVFLWYFWQKIRLILHHFDVRLQILLKAGAIWILISRKIILMKALTQNWIFLTSLKLRS